MDQGYLSRDEAKQRNFDRETAIDELELYNQMDSLVKDYLKK